MLYVLNRRVFYLWLHESWVYISCKKAYNSITLEIGIAIADTEHKAKPCSSFFACLCHCFIHGPLRVVIVPYASVWANAWNSLKDDRQISLLLGEFK